MFTSLYNAFTQKKDVLAVTYITILWERMSVVLFKKQDSTVTLNSFLDIKRNFFTYCKKKKEKM